MASLGGSTHVILLLALALCLMAPPASATWGFHKMMMMAHHNNLKYSPIKNPLVDLVCGKSYDSNLCHETFGVSSDTNKATNVNALANIAIKDVLSQVKKTTGHCDQLLHGSNVAINQKSFTICAQKYVKITARLNKLLTMLQNPSCDHAAVITSLNEVMLDVKVCAKGLGLLSASLKGNAQAQVLVKDNQDFTKLCGNAVSIAKFLPVY